MLFYFGFAYKTGHFKTIELFEVSLKKSFKSLAVTCLVTTNPVFMRYFKVLHKNMHKKFRFCNLKKKPVIVESKTDENKHKYNI